MIESEVVAAASVKAVLSGKHYNRCIRSHKLVFEAMQRLRLIAFQESLQGSASEKLSIIGEKLLSNFEENMAELLSVDEDFTYWKTAYESFIQKRSEENPTFAFWSTYIEMVQLMLLFIRATRTSDWNLHLSTLRSMIPWFFVTDRINYSRYSPCYWLEMSSLESTHPCEYVCILFCETFLLLSYSRGFLFTVIAENIADNWTVQRHENHSFASIPCDQTIEQTMNKDSKTKGGIVGFTLKKGAVHRWILGQSERCAISRKCQEMANITDVERYY